MIGGDITKAYQYIQDAYHQAIDKPIVDMTNKFMPIFDYLGNLAVFTIQRIIVGYRWY